MNIDKLVKPESPWIHIVIGESFNSEDYLKEFKKSLAGGYFAILNGEKMHSINNLYVEFADKLRFPDYFGFNGNAFDECINDLEWLEAIGYLLIVENGDELLIDDEKDSIDWFIETISAAGDEWSIPVEGEWARNSIPFHLVINVKRKKNTSLFKSFESHSDILEVVE